MQKSIASFLLFSLVNTILLSQQKSDIFLFDLVVNKNDIVLYNSRNVTAMHIGYNNQPHFASDEALLFSSNHENATFTDIFKLDIPQNKISPFTQTDSISEYSPTLSLDKSYLYTVRAEKDGKTQTLWKYPLDQSNHGQRLFEDLNNIGYFTFFGKDQCAMFLVTDPISLSIIDLKANKKDTVLYEIGRCLRIDKDRNLLVTQKVGSEWVLKRYKKNKFETICNLTSQDFEYLASGHIICSDKTKLVAYNIKKKKWNTIQDLSELKISNITRIASTLNHLAIVTNR